MHKSHVIVFHSTVFDERSPAVRNGAESFSLAVLAVRMVDRRNGHLASTFERLAAELRAGDATVSDTLFILPAVRS